MRDNLQFSESGDYAIIFDTEKYKNMKHEYRACDEKKIRHGKKLVGINSEEALIERQ